MSDKLPEDLKKLYDELGAGVAESDLPPDVMIHEIPAMEPVRVSMDSLEYVYEKARTELAKKYNMPPEDVKLAAVKAIFVLKTQVKDGRAFIYCAVKCDAREEYRLIIDPDDF